MSAGLSSTLHHLRPTLWPFLWAHCLTGFLLAVGGGLPVLQPAGWLYGLVASGVWAVFLGGPAAALTAVFRATPGEADRSDKAPTPAAPVAVGWAALVLMLAGLLGSPAMGWGYFDAYLVGLVLVVLHAVPPLRLGRFRVGSFCVQAVGCGAFTLQAGRVAAGASLIPQRTVALGLIGFSLLFVAMRVLLWEERTRLAPWLYAVCVAGGFLCLGLSEAKLGAGWTAAALAVPPLAAWGLLALGKYLSSPGERRSPRLSVALGAWFLTDAALVLAMLVR